MTHPMSERRPVSAADVESALQEILIEGPAGPGIITSAVVNADPAPPLTYAEMCEAIRRRMDAPYNLPPRPPRYLVAYDEPWRFGDPIDVYELVDGAYRRMGGVHYVDPGPS